MPLQTPTPPTITFAPTNGSFTNDNTTDITLKFNETVRKINDTPITSDNAHTLLTLTKSGSTANIAIQTNTTFSSNTITINPTNNLPDGIYTITLPANTVEDTNNNAITSAQGATFTIDATDPSFSYNTVPGSLTVNSAISIMSPTLTETNPKSIGGYALKVEAGNSLPPGLALDPDTGNITGTPTTPNTNTRTTTIVVTDAAGNTGEHPIIFPLVSAALPGAPQSFTATAGDGEVTLSWSAPTSDGGATITKYRYIQKIGTNAYTAYDDVPGSDGSTTSHTFISLTNDVAHSFKICAYNSVGCGTETREQTATPQLPDTTAPTVTFAPDGTSTVTDNTTDVTLTFSEPIKNRHGRDIKVDESYIDGNVTFVKQQQ